MKTPITAIKGYVEGIIDGVADTPEKMDRYIRTIYNKANEMDTLINELTLYSQIDTNRIPYNFNRIDVSEYFNDCIEELTLDLEAKNIGLAYFNYTKEDIQIIADPEQLKRVINNIVGNSAKYLDKQKGFINIRVRDVGDFIQVEIEDNGKGIAAKDLPYVALPGGRFSQFGDRRQRHWAVYCQEDCRGPRRQYLGYQQGAYGNHYVFCDSQISGGME